MFARSLILTSLMVLCAATAAAQTALPPETAPQGTPLAAPAEPSAPAPTAGGQTPSVPSPAPELPPAPAAEQSTAAEQQPARVFCDQNVAVRLDDPASAPDQYRRFVGVWSDAAWDVRTCAALIVQHVEPDGKASIVYIYGPEGSRSTVAGVILHGTGVIKDGELRFQNSDGSQYAFRPRLVGTEVVDMVGYWINPKGDSFQATFKQTP
jgi:hypothetical protein